MKTFIYTLSLVLLLSIQSQAQVIINEFQPETNTIELKNIGSTTVDVSSYEACSFPVYDAMEDLTLVSGSLNMAPGDILVVSGHTMGVADDELGIYSTPSYTNPDAMMDYVEWGSTGHQRSTVAVAAGIWNTGDFLDFFPGTDETYMWDGNGDAPANWFTGADTFGEENSVDEACAGGSVSTTDEETSIQVTVGDGTADVINFEADGGLGDYAFIITDDADAILAVMDGSSHDFEDADAGICHVYGAGYLGTLTANVGADISTATADECFSLSTNFVEVNRIASGVEETGIITLNVWPNPAQDILFVKIPELYKGGLLRVTNMHGQVILTQQVLRSNEELNLQSLASGNYVVELIHNNGIARTLIQK